MQRLARQRKAAGHCASVMHVTGTQWLASQRSVLAQSASAVHSGGATQRKPSQRSGGGQSALVPQRRKGVQRPRMQISPALHDASVVQGTSRMQRSWRMSQCSPVRQSLSRAQLDGTQRPSRQRSLVAQSASLVQSHAAPPQGSVHTPAAQVWPIGQSALVMHVVRGTHAPRSQTSPAAHCRSLEQPGGAHASPAHASWPPVSWVAPSSRPTSSAPSIEGPASPAMPWLSLQPAARERTKSAHRPQRLDRMAQAYRHSREPAIRRSRDSHRLSARVENGLSVCARADAR